MWYAKARYYDSDLGRFVAEDPLKGNIADIQSQNLYPYVRNNPLKYVDLDGKEAKKLDYLGLDIEGINLNPLGGGGGLVASLDTSFLNININTDIEDMTKDEIDDTIDELLDWINILESTNVFDSHPIVGYIKDYIKKLQSIKKGMSEVYAYVEAGNTNPFSLQQQQANADYIHDYLKNEGWTTEAISALLGNIQVESYLNPSQWQYMSDVEYGYGLVQWDDATKFLDAKNLTADKANKLATNDPNKLMDLQLEFLIDTMKPGAGEWLPSTAVSKYDAPYKMSYNEFISSTNNIGELTKVFNSHYERSGTPHMDRRVEYATDWYDYFNK